MSHEPCSHRYYGGRCIDCGLSEYNNYDDSDLPSLKDSIKVLETKIGDDFEKAINQRESEPINDRTLKMPNDDLPFGSPNNTIQIDRDQALELYKLLSYQYISHIDYPLVHKLIHSILEKFPDAISR